MNIAKTNPVAFGYNHHHGLRIKSFNPLNVNEAKMSDGDYARYIKYESAGEELIKAYDQAYQFLEIALCKIRNGNSFGELQGKDYCIAVDQNDKGDISRISTYDTRTGKQNVFCYKHKKPIYVAMNKSNGNYCEKVYSFDFNVVYAGFSYDPNRSPKVCTDDSFMMSEGNTRGLKLPQDDECNQKIALDVAKAIFY